MKIQFGINNSVDKNGEDYENLRDIKADERTMSFLGIDTDACEVTVGGIVVDDDYIVREDDTLSFRTKANSKG